MLSPWLSRKNAFAEQVVELWNQRMVIGDGACFELAQSSLELCRVKFHCALLSIPSRAMRTLRALRGLPLRSLMRSSVIPRGLRNLFSGTVK
jgi:hypothetical protein